MKYLLKSLFLTHLLIIALSETEFSQLKYILVRIIYAVSKSIFSWLFGFILPSNQGKRRRAIVCKSLVKLTYLFWFTLFQIFTKKFIVFVGFGGFGRFCKNQENLGSLWICSKVPTHFYRKQEIKPKSARYV